MLKEIEKNPEAWSKYVEIAAQKKKDDLEKQRLEVNAKRLLALQKNAESSSSPKVIFGKTSTVVSGGQDSQPVEKSPVPRKPLDAVRKSAIGKAISTSADNVTLSECSHISIDLEDVSHISESPVSVSSDIVLPNGSGDFFSFFS